MAFDADGSTMVRDVKDRLAEQWGVPPMCQSLVAGSRELLDDEELQAVCQGAESDFPAAQPVLKLEMIVSYAPAYTCLESCNHIHKRADAVEAVARAATNDYDRVVGALVVALTKDQASEVRSAAVGALSRVAESGDVRVVAALCGRLRQRGGAEGRWRERDAGVRREVIEAVGKVAHAGDDSAIASIFQCLVDCDEVQQAALSALQRIAVSGDDAATSGISEHMKNRDERIRVAAQKALSDAARAGNHKAIAAAFGALIGDIYVIRRQAVWAFAAPGAGLGGAGQIRR